MRFRAFSSLVLLCVLAAPAAAQRGSFDPDATYPVPTADSPVRGADEAPVTIVEFSDFRCQYCARAQGTLAKLERLYPGQLRVVYRQLPLDIEDGTMAAEAALAAAEQGQFWPMHDRLFASPGPFTRPVVEGYARELGLDMARFRRALDTRAHLGTVERDFRAALELGFSSTPMFFVNGRPVRGAQPVSVFAEVIEEELERAEALIRSGVERERLYEHIVATAEPPEQAPEDAAWEAAELEPASLYAVGLGLPGHAIGPEDALVTVIEFTDFECGYCAKMFPAVEQLLRDYPDDVRVVYRHLPLRFHPRAQLAAEAAVEAARQGHLAQYARALFADQRALERADLERRAEAIGLDMKRFRAALDDRRHLDAVAADAAAANALGITGTPTLFVNGTPVVGALPYERLRAIVEAKLDQARQMVASGVERSGVYSLIAVAAERDERGDKSRIPTGTAVGSVDLDQVDYRTAVLAACKARDGERAATLYDKLRRGERADVRGSCRTYGVDLD